MHGIGGGTGSGFTTLLMSKCKDEYDIPISSFCLFPSVTNNKQPGQWPINVAFGLHEMNKLCDGVFVLDWDSLFDITSDLLHINNPRHEDINFVAYQAINDIMLLQSTNGACMAGI